MEEFGGVLDSERERRGRRMEAELGKQQIQRSSGGEKDCG